MADKETLFSTQESHKDSFSAIKLLSTLTDIIVPEIQKSNHQLKETGCLETIQSIVNDSQNDTGEYLLYQQGPDTNLGLYSFEFAPKSALRKNDSLPRKVNFSLNHDFLRLLIRVKTINHQNHLFDYYLQLIGHQGKKAKPVNIIKIFKDVEETSKPHNFIILNKARITAQISSIDNFSFLCFNTSSLEPGFQPTNIPLQVNLNIQTILDRIDELTNRS